MVDRIALVTALTPLAKLSATTGKKFNDQLTKALCLVLSELPLDAARSLPPPTKGELVALLRSALTVSELKAVGKKWEPRRKPDGSETQSALAARLIEVLSGEREPYVPPAITLSAARLLSDEDRDRLASALISVAPLSDLKKLAKKWDKHNADLQSAARSELVSSLQRLMFDEVQPAPRLQ